MGEWLGGGVCQSLTSSGPRRLLLKASCSVDTLVLSISETGQDRGRSEDFLFARPVAKEKDPGSCLYLEPTVGHLRTCLETQSVDSAGGWPLSLALGFRALLWASPGKGQGVPLAMVFLGVPMQETLK